MKKLKDTSNRKIPEVEFEDKLVKQIYDHMYGKGKKLAFNSICYPFGGYYIMRSGWTGDALHLFFKNSRPGTGHCSKDRNNIQVTAFGRTMLIDSGPSNYTYEFTNEYVQSSAAHNTIVVDNFNQNLGNDKIIDYDKTIETLWHTSEDFDIAEGVHSCGYEAPSYDDKTLKDISEVTHKRQVIFLRKLGLWIICDIIQSENEHEYCQAWNFSHEYDKDKVKIDTELMKVETIDEQGANVALYSFFNDELKYNKYFGEKETQIRGWYKSHWQSKPIPAVDVHCTWSGKGSNLLITVIEPRSNMESNIMNIDKLKDNAYENGFEINLKDGTIIRYKACTEKKEIRIDEVSVLGNSLIKIEDKNNKKYGLALGVNELSVNEKLQQVKFENFEFAISEGEVKNIVLIEVPQTFSWIEKDEVIYPKYI